MAVFTFKFDESYNHRTLVVAGWIAEERQWKKLARRWQKAINYENRSLPEGRKISRYHAANMNANDHEFKGWKDEPGRSLRFTKKLFRILGTEYMTAVAVGMDVQAFQKLFPDSDPPGMGMPYIICVSLLMGMLGDSLENRFQPEVRLAMVHDHGDWDAHVLQAYNQRVDDPRWRLRHRFVSITPMTWRGDIGLQAADLIAYEAMRAIDDEMFRTTAKMRKALEALVEKNGNIYAAYLDANALEKFVKEYYATREKSKLTVPAIR